MANMFDDLIQQYSGRQQAEPRPIRYMEEPNAVERFIGGINLPAWMDDLRGSEPYRVMQGMADPVVGAVQTVANVLPDSTGIPQAVNKRIADQEAQYQAARRARSGEDDPGFDAMRVAGTMASPANLAIGARLPSAATAGARALQGAAVGGGTAAMQPVTDTSEGFWAPKAGQVAIGAASGAVMTPILGAVGERVIRALGNRRAAAISTQETDRAIAEALTDMGQTIHDIPPAQLFALRHQVTQALSQGRQLDAAAVLRKADFDALDMDSTLGQITRDPMQFARERNLRGVEGVGEPLTARFQDQGNKLSARMGAMAQEAKDRFNAGNQFVETLGGVDEALNRHVSGLYREARQSAGKDLDIPLQGLAQDYADTLRRFGDKIPSGVRNAFEDLGLIGGTQRRVFNFEEADSVLKTINANSSNDPATNNALRELRGALRRSLESVDAGGGPFAPAVAAARERFALHDAVPALKAVARGKATPDDFVNRFIVSGKTNEVKGLAEVLKQADLAAWQEAKAQLADSLKLAAFGENVVGDKAFSPERYMKEIRRIGIPKLGAFFNASELNDILRVGRVGAYINQAPNASAVSSSNSQVGLINTLARVPGPGALVRAGQAAAGAVQRQGAVNRALAADVPTRPRTLRGDEENVLRYFLELGGFGSGALGGSVGK